MLRRDFFKALASAAAALSAAPAALAASTAGRTPTAPQVAVTADTEPLNEALQNTREMLRGMLRDCRVRSCSRHDRLDGIVAYKVEYRHDPDGPLTDFDAQVSPIAAIGHIMTVNVAIETNILDITHLGHFSLAAPEEVERIIEVTYLVPAGAE
jgi:hypothetical protein